MYTDSHMHTHTWIRDCSLVIIIRWLNVTLFSFFLLMHLIMSITFVCLEKFDSRLLSLGFMRMYYQNKLRENGFIKKHISLVSTLSYSFRREWNVHETKCLFTCNKHNFFFFEVDLYLCAFHLVKRQNQHNIIGYWK